MAGYLLNFAKRLFEGCRASVTVKRKVGDYFELKRRIEAGVCDITFIA